jgi:hypothetical protein
VSAQYHMKWGLLWFDDDRKAPLAARVEKAARRYREKFGRSPDVCYVNPVTLSEAEAMPAHVKIIERTSIQPNHFWIGVGSSSSAFT